MRKFMVSIVLTYYASQVGRKDRSDVRIRMPNHADTAPAWILG